MVVFTCNNCGDSLQKPKVEKHYATSCRGAKNLTCVDCLKDFRGEEYTAHTKCITEQERYSAKGSVTNVIGKGEAKQQQWSDTISEIIQNTKPTGAQKFIFQIISNQTQNVPRKKMKFMNFIKNSAGNKVNYPDIEAVWDLIEKHKAVAPASVNTVDSTTTEPPKEEATKTDTVKDSSPKKKSSESDTVNDTISSQDHGTEGKKKKKRKSQNINVTPITNSNLAGNGSEEISSLDEGKKKKKRKSENLNIAPFTSSNGGNLLVNENEEISLQGEGKKKKKRKSDTTSNLLGNGSEEISSQDDGGDGKKKKKRKSENINITSFTTTNGGNLLVNGNEEFSGQGVGSEGTKKKKRKSENVNATIGTDNHPINERKEKTKKRKSDTLISEVNGSDIHAEINSDIKKKMNNVPENSIVDESSKPNDSISQGKKKQIQENKEAEAKKAKLDDSIFKEKKKGKPQTGEENTNSPEAVASADERNLNGSGSSLTDSFIRITLKKLQKKNSLPLDKLQKKVLAEYCTESNVTESPKLVKQFKKKLQKMKGVEIVDDNVRLKTLDQC